VSRLLVDDYLIIDAKIMRNDVMFDSRAAVSCTIASYK